MAQPYRVEGIGQVMQILQQIAPEHAKEARKKFKTDARPIVNAIRSSFPEVALSRWQPPKQGAAPGVVERTVLLDCRRIVRVMFGVRRISAFRISACVERVSGRC